MENIKAFKVHEMSAHKSNNKRRKFPFKLSEHSVFGRGGGCHCQCVSVVE